VMGNIESDCFGLGRGHDREGRRLMEGRERKHRGD
jgi:hypothetical protein